MHTSDNGVFVIYCLDVACRSAQSLSAAIQANMSANCHLFFRQSVKCDCAIIKDENIREILLTRSDVWQICHCYASGFPPLPC